MATLYGTQYNTSSVDTQAAEHNAQISARFQELQNVAMGQMASITQQAQASAQVSRTPVLSPERPVAPVTQPTSSVFTAETLDRTLEANKPVVQEPVAQPAVQENQAHEVAEKKAEGYLTGFAKVFLGACATAIVLLVCLIGVFTQVINSNQMKISAMEAQNAQLRGEYSRVLEELQEVTSPETVEGYAQERGMVKGN